MSPLSDREQEILKQIERSLYDEDPDFARGVRRPSPRWTDTRRFQLGVASFVAGFLILIAFFVSRLVVVGVVAFGAMVAGIVLFAGSLRNLMASEGRLRGSGGERIRGRLKRWEQRLRERHKRR